MCWTRSPSWSVRAAFGFVMVPQRVCYFSVCSVVLCCVVDLSVYLPHMLFLGFSTILKKLARNNAQYSRTRFNFFSRWTADDGKPKQNGVSFTLEAKTFEPRPQNTSTILSANPKCKVNRRVFLLLCPQLLFDEKPNNRRKVCGSKLNGAASRCHTHTCLLAEGSVAVDKRKTGRCEIKCSVQTGEFWPVHQTRVANARCLWNEQPLVVGFTCWARDTK